MSTVNLASNVRQGLLSLQDTAGLQATTTQHLSTGKKVSSALDNPVNFFTAAGLDSRTSQLSGLLDGMSNGIQVIQAANKGLTSITSLLQQLQSTVKTARQDSSSIVLGATLSAGTNTATGANKNLTVGLAGGVNVNVALTTAKAATLTGAAVPAGTGATVGANKGGDIQISSSSLSGGTVKVTLADADTADGIVTKINAALDGDSNGANIRATKDGTGKVVLTDFNGNATSVVDSSSNTSGTTAAAFGGVPVAAVNQSATLTTDLLVKSINNNSALTGKVTATKGSTGQLQLQNGTGSDITLTGYTATALDGGTATKTLSAGTPFLSATRQNAANTFNSLLDQLDTLAKDSGFNGTNLLAGDKLKLTFNEKTGNDASTLSVQTQNPDGTAFGALSSLSLGLTDAATTADGTSNDFTKNDNLDAITDKLTKSLSTIQTQSSQLGSALALTQTRQDFTKQIIDVLKTGSSTLTDADMNEEAANSQALSTRQSVGISALSLANTANQGILQLLR
ncbi:flagellar protein [Methylobacterium sp. WL122]|nr:flagellar protein [Methylobacterium sp. WL122]